MFEVGDFVVFNGHSYWQARQYGMPPHRVYVVAFVTPPRGVFKSQFVTLSDALTLDHYSNLLAGQCVRHIDDVFKE